MARPRGTLGSSALTTLLALALMFGTDAQPLRETTASWYGEQFFGHTTACGQVFSAESWGVAHPWLPCGTVLEIWHGERMVIVTVEDRGPFVGPSREIDLAPKVRDALACPDLCSIAYRGAP